MPLTRREFFSNTAAAGLVVASTHAVPGLFMRAAAAIEQRSSENVLVVIQLTGGNDGLNTVIPYADDVYHKNRFATRITEDRVHRIDDYVGFHPALAGLSELLEQERLAVVQGVGYPNPNRSHFESMDIWHTARRSPGARQTGWLGKYLDTTRDAVQVGGDVPAVHLGTEVQPLALAGLNAHVLSIASLTDFRLRDANDPVLADAIESLADLRRPEASELVAYLADASRSALAASNRVQAAVERTETGVEYPQTKLAQKLGSVAKLIDAGLSTRIYYATLDGFDTHSGQPDAHAGLLTELGGAVAAFVKDLTERGHDRRVLVMCFSEFGRRVKENASQGTDHGAAAPVLVAGGRVRPGLIGDHPSLTDLEDGDLKFHTDFRRVYAAVLEDWLGADSEPLLGDTFERLPLLSV